MHRRILEASLVTTLLAACNGTANVDPPVDAAVATDTVAATDTPVAQDVATVTDVPTTPTDATATAAMNGCTEAMFVDQTMGTANDRMIMTQGSTNAFDYPCMTISAGQSVLFMWAFSRHPLAPGLAPGELGDAPAMNPITTYNTGTVHSIRFPTAGLYPFYCSAHPGTMKGVIRVR